MLTSNADNWINDKTVERIVTLVPMMTAAEWWWMLMWNLYSPGCWLNVINSLSGPIPVPNWSIQVPQHQLNCDVSPYYLQSTIYWAAVHISQRHSDYLSHHFPQGRTKNCLFPLLRELIWKKTVEISIVIILWDWLKLTVNIECTWFCAQTMLCMQNNTEFWIVYRIKWKKNQPRAVV